MNPLNSILGTIISGFVLAVIIVFALGAAGAANLLEIQVWFHVLAGVVWIGLLYYFNFVQVPAVGQALSEANSGGPGAAAINKYVAPRALLWFRWGAVATWLTGVGALQHLGEGGALAAFTLQEGWRIIGIGAWLGTIMLFNVWVLIWPNQEQEGRPHGLAYQYAAVHPDADVHDGTRARPALLIGARSRIRDKPNPIRPACPASGRAFSLVKRKVEANTRVHTLRHAGQIYRIETFSGAAPNELPFVFQVLTEE
jgi:hypothetical protein